MRYDVRFYWGDYAARQRAANADRAICYVEHHFNSGSDTANFGCVVVARNASPTTIRWARTYCRRLAREFADDLRLLIGGTDGVIVGGYRGRGNFNLRLTAMPAILVEPLFASNPRHAAIIRSSEGQGRLAAVLVDSIREIFPSGGIVAFSVGHKGKTHAASDRGAPVVGGGYEADYAEAVMLRAKAMLTVE